MTIVKRLRLLTAILGAAAACAVVGTVVADAISSKSAPAARTDRAAPKLIDELAKTKFSDTPALAYRLTGGGTAFAWQVKPTLVPAAPRPKDVLVMVDTSASQAGDPLRQAAQVVAALSHQLGKDDRVDVWTVNLDHERHTRSLTDGFKPAADAAVRKAADGLVSEEYAAGAVDLKAGLEKVLTKFDRKAGRQQVILYLGDGESAASDTPLTEAVRVDLGRRMVGADVQFFAVPLGATISANTLHGFGMLTGGCVVRVKEDLANSNGRLAFTKRLTDTLDVPVIAPHKLTVAPAGAELFPATLPPLRADRATLVVGTVPANAATLSLTVEGTVADQKTAVTIADKLPAPSPENYFVGAMLDQWKTAAVKDAPAVLAADRALAMASEQFRLYRDEFLVLALDAVAAGKLDHAQKLFAAATTIDPDSAEAKAGVKVIADLRSGKLNRKDLEQKVTEDEKTGRKLINFKIQEPAPAAGGVQPPAAGGTAPTAEMAIKQSAAAQSVAEAEARALVEETLKRARTLRETDPDGAYEDLKRQRDNIRVFERLSDRVRNQLAADLESAMRDVSVKSSETKRRLAAERERVSRAMAFINEYDRQLSQDDQTTARIDRFRYLMRQAKYELAYREANVMEQERVNRGLTVPPEVYATYRIGQSATQLREQRELKRLREDRYLLTMLQVDKSYVPYPDEPPVHFPPASVWNELRVRRKPYRFENQAVGATAPRSLRLQQLLLDGKTDEDFPEATGQRVFFEGPLKPRLLRSVLEDLENQYKKRIKFIVREDLFKATGNPDLENIREKPFQNDANLSGMTLGSFLDVALYEFKASFIVRPDYIEITTMQHRIEEKVTRAFEIGDLAFAAPNSVNQQALQQNLAVFGSQLQFFGQAAGQAQFGLGGGAGFLGAGGGQQQGGALGGGLGALGAPGGALGGAGGQQMGIAGGLGAGGGNNLGVGGGVLGTTGGQLGQFGNLGGQFGIQGNNQAQILIPVITQLVARGEWDPSSPGVAPPLQNPDDEGPLFVLRQDQLNSIGQYPAANALIIRATSRYHPTQSVKFPKEMFNQNMQAPGNNRNRQAGGNPAGGGVDPNVLGGVGGLVGQAGDDKPGLRNPATDAAAVVRKAGTDPKKVWNEMYDWAVTDPQLIVEAAEFLFEFKEYAHAAESLKANLRKGHATGAWAYEALAIALQSSQAAPGEVERVALSGIDLDPADPKAYLRAAKAENDLGRADVAVRLCQRAADLEPNLPTAYLNALVYADTTKDLKTVKADVVGWATENLLRRDWPNDGIDYPKEVKGKVGRLAKKLTEAGRQEDADKLAQAVAVEKTRDLVVRLAWQGQADLDLAVAEPSGTDCSATRKRTTGGGVLRADVLEQEAEDRSEVYTAAHAFSGTYKVSVNAALGKAIGNRAQVIVTRFAGTDKQVEQLFTVDLADAKRKPIEFTLDGGSRTDLATVAEETMTEMRLATTAGPQAVGLSGMAAGFGGADAATMDMVNTATSAKGVARMVPVSQETRVPSVSPTMPGFRIVGTIAPGSGVASYTAGPVFAGKAVDIPMPKVQLLPGAGR